VAYNFGGSADCEERTVGGDDTSGTPPWFRGLRNHDGTGCNGSADGNNTGRGALDMIYVVQNVGGNLVLGNWNALGTSASENPYGGCLNPGAASTADSVGLCRRAHWLEFSTTPGVNVGAVPVPAALWMFGSAIGVLGALRRRIKA